MGRQREFSPDDALDAALTEFWSKGYEGTSYADLSAATGVARPGLYAVFGNKEELFFKALDRYETLYMGFMGQSLALPKAKAVIGAILSGSINLQTAQETAKGCLGINGAIACTEPSEPVRLELVRRRKQSEKALAVRLQQAKDEGDLPPSVVPKDLARYVMTVTQGMAVQAKAGASKAELRRVADILLAQLP
ncbi:TetR/AcrR family transcriptional regulator [Pseudomonas hormoni]|uniref:TetR/AcrR family transcriptional regulator n=1 Tax=Pseudomonas hormoni TaxID=3093767 RepID=A0ABX8F2H1_9PSED|nr:TetR/AcrR family transcriptional regulator [Pseudomonas hormoni]QVW26129.1 TetR/AcrR family transcriptional regulator [Pseudomonas hormoni]